MATNPPRDETKKRARDETEVPPVHYRYVVLCQEELEQEDFLRGEGKRLSGPLLQHRQICADSTLFNEYFEDRLPANYIDDVTGNRELETKMMQYNDVCPICRDRLSYKVITSCGHVFCRRCLWAWLTTEASKSKCAYCRNDVSRMYSAPESLNKNLTISSKASVILDYLRTTKEENPLAKSVVFSNFPKALKSLDRILTADGFSTLDCFTPRTTDEIKEAIGAFSVLEATVLLSCLQLSARVSLRLKTGARVDHTAAPTLFSNDDKDAVTIYFLDLFEASDVELAILYLQKFGQIHKVKERVMLIVRSQSAQSQYAIPPNQQHIKIISH